MLDQAAELRILVSQATRQMPTTLGPRPRLVVFSGAKGGVGVTTLAINIAITLVDQGLRAVLIDADLYRADVAPLCKLPERGHVGDILTARRDIHEVLEPGPGGIMVVPGVWAPDNEIPFSQHAQHRLLKQIHSLGRHADIVLMDVGSAASENVYRSWAAADEVVLITTPDSVAVMDCYATIKSSLVGGAEPDKIRLVVNRAENSRAAEDVFRRIDQSARRFLNREIEWLGSVEYAPDVLQVAASPIPPVLAAHEDLAARAIQQIAASLATSAVEATRSAA